MGRVRADFEPFDVVVALGDHDVGGEQHGAGAQGRQPVALAFNESGDPATELIPCLPDPDELFRDIRNDPLRRVCGR